MLFDYRPCIIDIGGMIFESLVLFSTLAAWKETRQLYLPIWRPTNILAGKERSARVKLISFVRTVPISRIFSFGKYLILFQAITYFYMSAFLAYIFLSTPNFASMKINSCSVNPFVCLYLFRTKLNLLSPVSTRPISAELRSKIVVNLLTSFASYNRVHSLNGWP